MDVKSGYNILKYAQSPMSIPVTRYTRFPSERGRRAIANPVKVDALTYEVGEHFLIDFAQVLLIVSGTSPAFDKGVWHQITEAGRGSSQTPRTVSLAEYIRKAMRHATYEVLSDGTFYAEIPGFQGVWANTSTLEACVEELRSVLEDWALSCFEDGLSVPEVDGVRFLGKEHV